jgi:hypothetical protein
MSNLRRRNKPGRGGITLNYHFYKRIDYFWTFHKAWARRGDEATPEESGTIWDPQGI